MLSSWLFICFHLAYKKYYFSLKKMNLFYCGNIITLFQLFVGILRPQFAELLPTMRWKGSSYKNFHQSESTTASESTAVVLNMTANATMSSIPVNLSNSSVISEKFTSNSGEINPVVYNSEKSDEIVPTTASESGTEDKLNTTGSTTIASTNVDVLRSSATSTGTIANFNKTTLTTDVSDDSSKIEFITASRSSTGTTVTLSTTDHDTKFSTPLNIFTSPNTSTESIPNFNENGLIPEGSGGSNEINCGSYGCPPTFVCKPFYMSCECQEGFINMTNECVKDPATVSELTTVTLNTTVDATVSSTSINTISSSVTRTESTPKFDETTFTYDNSNKPNVTESATSPTVTGLPISSSTTTVTSIVPDFKNVSTSSVLITTSNIENTTVSQNERNLSTTDTAFTSSVSSVDSTKTDIPSSYLTGESSFSSAQTITWTPETTSLTPETTSVDFETAKTESATSSTVRVSPIPSSSTTVVSEQNVSTSSVLITTSNIEKTTVSQNERHLSTTDIAFTSSVSSVDSTKSDISSSYRTGESLISSTQTITWTTETTSLSPETTSVDFETARTGSNGSPNSVAYGIGGGLGLFITVTVVSLLILRKKRKRINQNQDSVFINDETCSNSSSVECAVKY